MYKKTITLLSALLFFITTQAQVADTLVKMYDQGKFQEIIETYGSVSNQEDPEILKILAFSYFQLRDDNAFKAIDKAISLSDDKIDYYYAKSRFYRQLEDYNKEIEVLKKILEIKESPNFLQLMVEPHLYIDDAANAHKYIDKAIALAANKLPYYFLKSDIFITEDKWSEAIALLENILKQEENDVVKFKLAQTYSEANKYELAIAMLQEMLGRLPDNEEIALEIFKTSFSNKKYGDGIEHLKTFIKTNGGSIDTFYALAQLYSKNNDYENSKYYYNKAIELPNNSEDQIKSLVLSMAQNDINFFEFDNASIRLNKLYIGGLNENKQVLEGLIVSNYARGFITNASAYHSELLKLNLAGKIEDLNRTIAKIPYNNDNGYIKIWESYQSTFNFYYFFYFYNTKFNDTVSYSVATVFDNPIYQPNKDFKITITNEATATEKEVSYSGEAINYLDIIKFVREQVKIFKKE